MLYRRNKKYRKISKPVYIRFLIFTYLAEYLALSDLKVRQESGHASKNATSLKSSKTQFQFQITHYFAEQLRQITHYLAEQFQPNSTLFGGTPYSDKP